MRIRTLTLLCASALLACVAHAKEASTTVDAAALADETSGANWLAFGRTYSEQRYSPLQEINSGTVKDLGLAWSLDLPEHRSLLATPLVVDGVMYFTGSWSRIEAVDLRTRRKLWTYDPKVLEVAGDRARVFWDSNRGAAYWKGRLFVGTGDGRLIAVDA
ncbi:MAG: hypothetical protein RL434_2104, partial [Pseudomonadota bacterium]